MNIRKRVSILLFLSLLLVSLGTSPVYALVPTIRFVAPGGISVGVCNSWLNSCNLQFALGLAASGNQIWAKQGTYVPLGTRTDTFTLKNGVAVYGGFVGTETTLSQRNPTAHVTILSGDIGIAGDPSDNSYHVVTGSGTDSTAVLDGFTITGGNANDTSFGSGGGMYNSNGSPTLTNLTFTGNTAIFDGGGMYNANSSPTLTNVVFTGNSATNDGGGGMFNAVSGPSITDVTYIGNSAPNGGGVYDNGGAPTFTNVIFTGNQASMEGGAMYNSASSPTLSNVTFSLNKAPLASGYGGAMYDTSGNPILTDVTFSGNSADFGGAMETNFGSLVLTNVTFSGNSAHYGGAMDSSFGNQTLTNVTMSGNSATSSAGAINNSNNTLIIYDSILWSDGSEIFSSSSTRTITDSIVSGGCPSGAACLDVFSSNPHLGSLANNGGFTKTMALGLGSPAIDAGGLHSSCALGDQRGVKRPQGLACDIGAYEAPVTVKFRSIGSQDGLIIESLAHTNVGGSLNSGGPTLSLGDDAANRQFRSILSFSTASLPDNALIQSVQLKLKQNTVAPVGSHPISLLQGIMVDLKNGFFGSSSSLQKADFQASAGKTVGPFLPVLSGGFYTITLDSSTFSSVNLLPANGGLTQVRLRFKLGTNGNLIANVLSLISGNNSTPANRPTLIISYATP